MLTVNNLKKIALLPFLVLLAAFLPAGGRNDRPAAQPAGSGSAVRVSGTVRLVGNEPFTQLVISGQDNQWYIDSDDEPKLKNLQHRTVTVEGIETVTNLTFANGQPAGTRHTLSKIRVISVQ